MKNTAEVDLLVVGQGLAGSALAMRALARKYRILVIDQPSENRSSAVAAGLFNPVTGRKMSKAWLADELFPSLHHFYHEVEKLTGGRFFYPMPIYRPFIAVEEQNEWMGRSAETAYRDYVSAVSGCPAFDEKVNDALGGITLKQSGYLDTREYLDAVRRYLEAKDSYLEGTFEPLRLEIQRDFVCYSTLEGTVRGIKARRIVFCQGIGNRKNPWFDYLPIRPLKGEFLTIQCEWEKRVILNRGIYLVPGSGKLGWRVGATFNREDQTLGTSAWASQELRRKLDDLIRTPYTVTGQQWGFRPTTPDRRPILGRHPKHETLIIFNGLGTKGVSLAPYFSEVLIRWLETKGTISKEADVSRF